MNVAFSGLLTSALRKLKTTNPSHLSYSLMHNAFAMVLETAERALHLKKAKALLACGGAAQSVLFKRMIKEVAKENGVSLALTKDEYNRDNGAMIAYASYLVFKEFGDFGFVQAIPKYRVEELRRVASLAFEQKNKKTL